MDGEGDVGAEKRGQAVNATAKDAMASAYASGDPPAAKAAV
jgi:hypothetical protein